MDLTLGLRPKWRHPDPEVRAAAVRDMGAEDRARLAAVAREDGDAHVRRLALRKLDDVEALAHVAAHDPEAPLRALAAERLREVLVDVATSQQPAAECDAALARLDDERALVQVAAAAAHEPVRRAALARVAGARALRDVVRAATDPAIRHAALARLDDPAVLRAIAVGEGMGELGLAALDRIDDAATLSAIAETHQAPKAVRQRARERLAAGSLPLGAKAARARQLELSTAVHALRADADVLRAAERVHEAQREWRELGREVAPRDDVAERFVAACDAILADAALLLRREAEVQGARDAVEEEREARHALCERVEGLAGAEAAAGLREARAAWRRLPPLEAAAPEAARFARAVEACEARVRAWEAHDALSADLEALAREAEALAAASPPPAAKRWTALERRWRARAEAADGGADVAALGARFAAAGERLRERREEAERQGREAQEQNRARLDALCTRLGELAASETLKPGTARRQLDAADAALRDPGPLPPAERRSDWTARLTEARDALLRRMREVEETEEWRRWANAAAQEELIGRIEALLEANDLAEGARLLAGLQQEWERIATASRDKSQALWERFRAARNELRRRCDAYFAENLQKKRALCAEVAAVGDSTAWNETTALIKRVQAQWKEIGPVPGKHAKALWQELREPCDRFFARRKEHFDRVDGERRENAARKTALCERAEALADSTDWEATIAAMKELQAEWKRSGPPPRAEADALWARFRAACDRFFDRHRRRDELAREAALGEARAICERVEALAAALGGEASVPGDLGPQLDEAWGAWIRLEAGGPEAAALEQRLHAACERVADAAPQALAGTRLDPEATRKRREKLCARLDELAAGLAETPRARSLQEMALALRERLASNTIAGGQPGKENRQEAARELERTIAAWARLGPPLGEAARALAARFEAARAKVQETLR